MNLNFLRFFIPTDRKFFPLFEKAASNLEIGGQLIYQLMCTNNIEERSRLIRTIEDIEHIGDEITHEIFQELSKNFITPFDREDIHRLVSAIDDVLDYIHGCAKRIQLYKIEKFTPDLIINTSTEHMTEEWYHQIRFKEMESNPIVAIQSNNMFDGEGHVNCVHSIDHMKKKFPMKEILFEGELQLKGYKRVMLIGRP